MLRDYVDSRSPSPRLALSRLTPHAPLHVRGSAAHNIGFSLWRRLALLLLRRRLLLCR